MEKPKRLLSSVQAGLLSFPGRVGFHGISEGLVAFENILHPDLLSHHQGDSEQVQGGLQVFVGRQGILVGLGKLNLAC